MRLLQVLFRIVWGVGYLGNGILFLYVEWTYLRHGLTQIFNPLLHLQVLGTWLTNPLCWIFLSMAILGYYTTAAIEKRLNKNSKKPDIKAEKFVSQPLQTTDKNQSIIPSYSPVQPSYKQVDDSETEYVKQYVKLLKWAIQSSQKVQFSYENRNGEKSDLTVTPIRLKTIEQALCLEGYCHLRLVKKLFAIQRMRNVRIVSSGGTSDQSQSFPDSTVTESLHLDTPTQTTYQLQSPRQNAAQTLSTDAQNQKRPYIKCLLNELERIADAQWSNVKVLSEIHQELEFRSRKKAQVLRERISQRLMQLQGSQFM